MNLLNCILQTSLVSLALGTPQLEPQPLINHQHLANSQTTLLVSQKLQSNRPTTKTSTLSVEGEKTTIILKLYQYSNLFSTYFPEKDFLVDGSSSGEGTGVRFTANFGGKKNENAYVHFSFLRNFPKYSQISKFVNSKNGLIAANRWRVVSRTRNTSYPWAKEKIVFSQGKNIIGSIYVGEQKSKAFYVITHFPVEYGDGFGPRADLILRNFTVGS